MKIRTLAMLLVAVSALSACDEGSDHARSAADATPNDGPAPLADVGCTEVLASNPDLINVAFPDQSAKYWYIQLPWAPGTRFRLEGFFPNARYFSFNTYDAQLRQIDSLADYEIDPDPGSVNPYRSPAHTGHQGWGGSYTAYIVPSTVPDERPPNHLYSGSTQLPGGVAPPNPQISILYRVYVAADNNTGMVELPRVVMEDAGGDTAIIGMEPCMIVPDPAISLGINEAFAGASAPADWPLPPISGRFEPEYRKFYSLPDALTRGTPLAGVLPPDTSGGFLGNRDNAYLGVRYYRDQGDSYIVRARAPTWAGDPRTGGGEPQLRYWSFCTNEFFTQRFVACVRDEQVAIDADGYFTIVVSDPVDRPANANAEHGITWLPWGGAYIDSSAIYRHMLPAAHFTQSVQSVPHGTPEVDVMGEYYPRTVYCTRATMEAAGPSALDIYNACVAAYVPPQRLVP